MKDLLHDLYTLLEEEGIWHQTKKLKRNEFLKKANSIDTKLYYIESGSVRMFVDDGIEEKTIRFGYERNFIGAIDSQLTEKPSPIYIQALKETHIKSVLKSDLDNLNEKSTKALSLWTAILESLVYQQMEREYDLLTSSPSKRYQRVLKRSPQLFQLIPHKHIASYLRMTPETLSRIKKS